MCGRQNGGAEGRPAGLLILRWERRLGLGVDWVPSPWEAETRPFLELVLTPKLDKSFPATRGREKIAAKSFITAVLSGQ